ncbi:MAG TPA: hypothetical protein VFM33_09985 [Aquabacterium sp.]|nr:hypothetical protein [Aquabacterium sp.]
MGGSVAAAAEAIGISYQAVDKWPNELPPRIEDRVQAALWRRSQLNKDSDKKRKQEA